MPTSPRIVNLIPEPGEPAAGLTKPVQMSLRDVDTDIQPSLIHIEAGWAQVRSNGEGEFVQDLPRTYRSNPGVDPLNPEIPDIDVVAGGVQVTITADPQKSVYYTPIDAGAGLRSAMMTVQMDPTLTPDSGEAVFGIEVNNRNTAVFVKLTEIGGDPKVVIQGPTVGGTPSPNIVIDSSAGHNWQTSADRRYLLVWNELDARVELYALESTGTQVIQFVDISQFQEFDPTAPGDSQSPVGSAGDFTSFYGVLGPVGDSVVIGNVSITQDVGFPIVGSARPGNFLTLRPSDEAIRYTGGNPLNLSVSSWQDKDAGYLTNPDPSASVALVGDAQSIRMTKQTPGTSFAFSREEPGFERSVTDGINVEGDLFAFASQLDNARVTGMGVLVWDGQTALFLHLLGGGVQTLSLLRRGGNPDAADGYEPGNQEILWGGGTKFRLVADPRRNEVEVYVGDDLQTLALSRTFERADLPDGTELGIDSQPPFIAFGHITQSDSAGSFELRNLQYSYYYQAYSPDTGLLPDNVLTDPQWTLSTSGFQEFGPLYGLSLFSGGHYGLTPLGYFVQESSGAGGSSTIEDGQLVTTTDPTETQIFFRSDNTPFGLDKGAIFEVKLAITDFKPRARSSVFMVIDDGLRSYMLSFVDTDVGKFAGVAVRAGLTSFIEDVGTDGDAESLSFRVDWTQPHVYRMEHRPLDGLYIYVDNELALAIPESKRVDYPSSQFLTPAIAFGHFTTEGAVSRVDHMRAMFSAGYDVSFRKIEGTAQLEQSILDAQSNIVVFVEDSD